MKPQKNSHLSNRAHVSMSLHLIISVLNFIPFVDQFFFHYGSRPSRTFLSIMQLYLPSPPQTNTQRGTLDNFVKCVEEEGGTKMILIYINVNYKTHYRERF